MHVSVKAIAALTGWTRASYYMMGVFLLTVFLVACFWWPLKEDFPVQFNPGYSLWRQIDWLLLVSGRPCCC